MPDKVMVTRAKLDSLAEAVGSKSGQGVPLTIEGMEDAVLGIETGIQPSGTLAISKNGTHDVTKYASARVRVPTPEPKLQSVSVTPSKSEQSVTPDYGYDGLSDVSVMAIPSEYVVPTGTLYVTHNLQTNVSEYKFVNVTGIKKMQSKTVTPSTSSQRVYPDNAAYLLQNYAIDTDENEYTIPFDAASIADYDPLYLLGTAVFRESGNVVHSHNFTSDSDFYWDPDTELKRSITYKWANGGCSLNVKVFDGYLLVTYDGSNDAIDIQGTTITLVHRPYQALDFVDVKPIPSQYIAPSGTKSITENGTGIDVAQYASVDVAVESGPDLPTFSTSDFETFTCDKTYAECLALFNNKQRGAILSYQAESSSGTVEVREFLVGYSIIEEQGGPIRYCAVRNGVPVMQINYNVSGTITKSSPDSVGTLSVSANGTYDGELWNTVEVNVPSSTPTLQSKTATPTESQQTVSPDSGYDGLSSVTVGAISSTYVGSGITQRSSTDLTASGATVTVPAGYYSAQASKAVASGTAGTPTATKGTVSNHSVSVTPSVSNTTGYIEGGTKNGTAVTVSASELVSGSQTITDNGTVDVTNLASITVDIDFVTYYTSSSEPTSAQGSDGDIWLVTE